MISRTSPEDQVRAMASAFHTRMGGVRIHPGLVMTWLTRYAAFVLSRRMAGDDGKTAQERITERRSLRSMCQFGERVMFRVPRARITR